MHGDFPPNCNMQFLCLLFFNIWDAKAYKPQNFIKNIILETTPVAHALDHDEFKHIQGEIKNQESSKTFKRSSIDMTFNCGIEYEALNLNWMSIHFKGER